MTAPEQRQPATRKHTCDNCGEDWRLHCDTHLIPCCPTYRVHEAAAPAALDEALTLLKMAAPRSAIGGAAYDGWLGEVAAFLREYERLGREGGG